jgi:hypothetical protein
VSGRGCIVDRARTSCGPVDQWIVYSQRYLQASEGVQVAAPESPAVVAARRGERSFGCVSGPRRGLQADPRRVVS